MRFAINVPPFAEPAALVDLGVAAERAGWDAFTLWDHMVIDRAGVPIVDPWVTLGALAARTERIRLGTCVTPLARRRPQKVAREPFEYDGGHYRVEQVRFVPPPVQRPRPPIWVACTLPSRRALVRAARWDGIVPIKVGEQGIEFLTPDDVASIVTELHGRRGSLDGFDVVVNPGPPPTASVADFAAAGATWYMISMDEFPGWIDELREIVDAGPPR